MKTVTIFIGAKIKEKLPDRYKRIWRGRLRETDLV